ncbi:MAG: efflux RND transporter permease subunit, partial [Kiritimatiellae bacterium]|nr:efflux RND transporter permease subunit [Kiritimatiellia bacterium]
MSLASASVRRPVFTTMITLVVLLLGTVALRRTPVDLMPDVSYPTLSVSTEYENASPAEIEELITRPIEEAMSSIPGVEEILSTSSEGSSNVRIVFTWGTDTDAAAGDVRDRIDRTMRRLPENAERPVLRKFDITAFPILMMGATGKLDPLQIRRIVDEQVKYRIERVPGVAALNVYGGHEREIQVRLDADRLKSLGIPLDLMIERIKSANITLPAGTVESGRHEIVVRTPGEYTDLDQLRQLIVAVREGVSVRLEEVAEVIDTYARVTQLVRVNGDPSIHLSVNKQSGRNTVQVAQDVLAEIARINRDIPQIKIVPLMDTSRFIRRSITNVGNAALLGGVYAIVILLLFLRNLRSTLIIATAIPLSIVATFMLIYFCGFTLNLMTLGGLALGVGMLVDNAIVVIENIYRLRESDPALPAVKAATEGTGEVAAAIVASTLTTVVVFLPLVFVRGISGELFMQLAAVVVFALFCSLVVAMTVVPMLAARFLSQPSGETAGESWTRHLFHVTGRALDRMDLSYQRALRAALRHRGWIALGAALLLAGGIVLIPWVGSELMPAADEGDVRVSVETEVGTRLDVLDQTVRPIEQVPLHDVPEVENVLVSP